MTRRAHDPDHVALAQLLRRREARARAVAVELARHPRPDHVEVDGRRVALGDRCDPAEVYAAVAEACAAAAVAVEALLSAAHAHRCSRAATAIARVTPLTVDDALRLVRMFGPSLSADRAVAVAAEVPEEELNDDH